MSLHHRIAVAFVVVSLFPCAAGAMGVEMGVKAGANLASFRGEFADLADAQNRAGFVGGAFVAAGFAPDLALQVEVLLTQKGARFEGVGTDEEGDPTGSFDTHVKVDYLEFPVLLRGTLLRTAPVQPVYFLGPTVGICLGGKVESDGIPDADLEDLNTLDFGVALGGGAAFRLGGRKVTAELRYTTGFTDIYDLEGNAASVNSVFSFTAGVAF